MELCLGTVQLGMNYGIHNAGRPSMQKAMDILDFAFEHGITHFDSAAAYGEAESVIGAFVRANPEKRKGIHVISKISADMLEGVSEEQLVDRINSYIRRSIERMGIVSLDGCLLHDPILLTDEIIKAFSEFQGTDMVNAVGVSIDTPEEAMKALEYDTLSIIQVPYNVFDQRLEKCGFFQKAQEKGVAVYVRSILLQGLATMNHNRLPSHMQFAKHYVKRFHEICNQYHISYFDAAVSYVFSQINADYVVFGVDTIEQLAEYVQLPNIRLSDSMMEELREAFAFVEERLVNPNLWTRYH